MPQLFPKDNSSVGLQILYSETVYYHTHTSVSDSFIFIYSPKTDSSYITENKLLLCMSPVTTQKTKKIGVHDDRTMVITEVKQN